MAYRSSTGELGFYDDEPSRRPAERWDREKFERFRSRGPESRDSFHSDDRERSGSRRPRRNTEVEFNERDRGGSRTKVEIRDTRYEEEKPRRRPEFLDREESTPSEVANRALAPFRRKSVVDRDFGPPAIRRPARPQFVRRQSSLDTFDRRPMPRYGDQERDEWRPPTNVPIPLPIRKRSTRPKSTFREDDYEQSRYREPEQDSHEDYRDIEIRRERSTHRRRRRSKHAKRAPSSSSSSSSDSGRAPSVRAASHHSLSIHESRPSRPGKKGKTRMPKRLVHKSALLEKGYEFDEEDDFLIVRRALEKEQIDDVIKISESYKESRVTYRYEDNAPLEPPPLSQEIAPLPPPGSFHGGPPPASFHAPPPPASFHAPPPPPSSFHGPPPGSYHDHHSHHAPPPPPPPGFFDPHQQGPPPPPPESMYGPPPPHAHHQHHQGPGHNVRTVSPGGRTVYEERVEESNHINGPLTVLVPHRRARGEREIRDEIKYLEEERRVVRLERETDYEVVESKPHRDVVRVEKDRKAKKPNPLLVAAMVSTLS